MPIRIIRTITGIELSHTPLKYKYCWIAGAKLTDFLVDYTDCSITICDLYKFIPCAHHTFQKEKDQVQKQGALYLSSVLCNYVILYSVTILSYMTI